MIPDTPVLDSLLAPEMSRGRPVVLWPQFAFPQLHCSRKHRGESPKKHHLGLNLLPQPRQESGLRGSTHLRGFGGQGEELPRSWGLAIRAECATWLGFEIARQLQPTTSSDKNLQKNPWSLKMQMRCDAAYPCLAVIAKFLDSISQR